MENNIALICVDLQNDFMPTGSLPVPNGDSIIPVVNSLFPLFKTVIFTKDWHPANSNSFASNHEGYAPFSKLNESTLWPDHCVQDTPGADLHHGIQYGQIFGDFYIFKKGDDPNYEAFSGFDHTELATFLKERGIDTVYICGLAADYCCKETALDAIKEGFTTFFIIDAMKGISPDEYITWKEIEDKKGILIASSDINPA